MVRDRYRELGQGMVEYALILGLISLVAIGSLRGIGGSVSNILKDVESVFAGDFGKVEIPNGVLTGSELAKLEPELSNEGFKRLWDPELGWLYYRLEDDDEITILHDPQDFGVLLKESGGESIDYDAVVFKNVEVKGDGIVGLDPEVGRSSLKINDTELVVNRAVDDEPDIVVSGKVEPGVDLNFYWLSAVEYSGDGIVRFHLREDSRKPLRGVMELNGERVLKNGAMRFAVPQTGEDEYNLDYTVDGEKQEYVLKIHGIYNGEQEVELLRR